MRKLTELEFIEKARKIHGTKYDYSSVNFINSHTKIKIICPEHGEFLQSPAHHLNKKGCYYCGLLKLANHFRADQDVLIKRAIEKHGTKYDYSKVSYIRQSEPVEIICPLHGSFYATLHGHINGKKCLYCQYNVTISPEEFLHSNVYILYPEYSLEDKIKIFDWLMRMRQIHGNLYEYIFHPNIRIEDKITIICREHGEFRQTIHNHVLHKQKCPKCGRESATKHAQNNPSGWMYTDWMRVAKQSKRFDSYKVYILHCWNENESFFKVGKTFLTLKNRFRMKSCLPYQWKMIQIIESDDPKYISDLEKNIQRLHKQYKYLPSIKFNGMCECFSEIDLEKISKIKI